MLRRRIDLGFVLAMQSFANRGRCCGEDVRWNMGSIARPHGIAMMERTF